MNTHATTKTDVDYRYLNMDEGIFYLSHDALVVSVGTGARLMSIPNYAHNQCLVAAGHAFFSECSAIVKCRMLCNKATMLVKPHIKLNLTNNI